MTRVELCVNGRSLQVRAGISVAAALAQSGTATRRSPRGQPRAPLCGMGICFECRVCIDGEAHVRACLITVRDGMVVTTE